MVTVALVYLLVFGVLTIAGGVIGFVKAKSRASIIAGTIAGGALIFAGSVWFASEPSATHTTIHLVVGLAVSLALTARFAMTFRRSRKLMPAGLMALLGVLGLVVTTLALATRS